MSAATISVDDVGVRFYFDRLHRVTTPTLAYVRRGVTESWGLRGLSVEINGGDAVALIGEAARARRRCCA